VSGFWVGADFNFWIFGLVLGGENLLGFLKKLNPEEPKSERLLYWKIFH
jgi:hypothetical protein